MKLKIQDFVGIQAHYNFNFTTESMEGLDLVKPVEIEALLTSKVDHVYGTVYTVSGKFSAVLKEQCVRCLKEITQNVDGQFSWNFLDPKAYSMYLKSLKEEDEVDTENSFEEATSGEIDITDLVRQEIVLEMDSYPACEPTCDDDSEIQKYADSGIDQRWAKLLEIKG